MDLNVINVGKGNVLKVLFLKIKITNDLPCIKFSLYTYQTQRYSLGAVLKIDFLFLKFNSEISMPEKQH